MSYISTSSGGCAVALFFSFNFIRWNLVDQERDLGQKRERKCSPDSVRIRSDGKQEVTGDDFVKLYTRLVVLRDVKLADLKTQAARGWRGVGRGLAQMA